MLTPDMLYDYQRKAVLHQLYNDDSMLWLFMGAGKTPITLTTVVDRMRAGQVKKTLVFGPLRVIHGVWAREAEKWEHLKHLRFSVIHGTKEKRQRQLFADADVYLCNYENMAWLSQILDHYYISQGKPLPFDMVVYDEVSKLKNSTSVRMKGKTITHKNGKKERIPGWRKIAPAFKYRTGLTGTPASNGYLDLHGQYLAVDGGERLGEYVTHFRDSYFASDYMGWSYAPTDVGKKLIETKIHDITLQMSSDDYAELPAVIVNNIMVDLPPSARLKYDEVERDLFTRLDTGTEIELFNKASVSNKCLQMANGSPYTDTETGDWEALHDAKLDALESVLEEAGGSPVLCSYSFKADAARIMERFKKYKPVNLTATKAADMRSVIDKWNAGGIKLIVGHPACLHASTEVLTERDGWVRIIDVQKDDRVFDGVEFVNHDGCSYSGYKDVTDVFGITMTHDHKLLIDGAWTEADHVGDSEEVRQKALYKYEGDDSSVREMLEMRNRVQHHVPKRGEAQSREQDTLSALRHGSIPQHDRYQDSSDMVWNETSCEGFNRSGLRRSWHRNVRRVGRLSNLLRRHASRLLGRPDHRAERCERSVFERELHLGDAVSSAVEQAQQQEAGISRREHASGRAVSRFWCKQDDVVHASESRDECRRSCDGRKELTVQEKHGPEEHREAQCSKAHVFDLVNCGPRHRFLIRNSDGDVFVSHNSMGHGIDGLQDSGSILVWFGLNWSLELYEQMNARLVRNGQKNPVTLHRILCNDTVDLAVADALSRKCDDQNALRDSIQRYRSGVVTNELELCFL